MLSRSPKNKNGSPVNKDTCIFVISGKPDYIYGTVNRHYWMYSPVEDTTPQVYGEVRSMFETAIVNDFHAEDKSDDYNNDN